MKKKKAGKKKKAVEYEAVTKYFTWERMVKLMIFGMSSVSEELAAESWGNGNWRNNSMIIEQL